MEGATSRAFLLVFEMSIGMAVESLAGTCVTQRTRGEALMRTGKVEEGMILVDRAENWDQTLKSTIRVQFSTQLTIPHNGHVPVLPNDLKPAHLTFDNVV